MYQGKAVLSLVYYCSGTLSTSLRQILSFCGLDLMWVYNMYWGAGDGRTRIVRVSGRAPRNKMVVSRRTISSVMAGTTGSMGNMAKFSGGPSSIISAVGGKDLGIVDPIHIFRSKSSLSVDICVGVTDKVGVRPITRRIRQIIGRTIRGVANGLISGIGIVVTSIRSSRPRDSSTPYRARR